MTAIKIDIKTVGGSVLFSYEKEDNTIIKTLQEAVRLKKDLTGADLTEAYLIGADLTEAYLIGANLTGANLKGANLTRASLTEADLTEANLRGANLTGANLTEADLTVAEGIENTDWYKGCLQNILYILSYSKGEVQGLKDRLIAGKVNGSQYGGDCCCLIGSLSSEKKENTYTYCNAIPFYTKGLHNLGEQFFYQIKEGDTVESNIFVKDAIMCCDMILGSQSQ